MKPAHDFTLRIIQEPFHGKAIGFKQVFGNFLDPALIIHLDFHSQDLLEARLMLPISTLVCQATLYSDDESGDRSVVLVEPGEDSQVTPGIYPNLRGQRQATCELWRSPLDDSKQLYFVFPDLSIRAMGVYRIVCQAFDMAL
ncbi:hypothetical protein HDU91_000217 [Kappamyces sp. JEL0680]|nr:hypothetical protein HDU91_000217 [Kappamyces sp. JEL0680]